MSVTTWGMLFLGMIEELYIRVYIYIYIYIYIYSTKNIQIEIQVSLGYLDEAKIQW